MSIWWATFTISALSEPMRGRNTGRSATASVQASAGMVWLAPVPGSLALGAALLVFLHYFCLSRKQFGGTTGDLAGYFLQICELAILAALILGGGCLWK